MESVSIKLSENEILIENKDYENKGSTQMCSYLGLCFQISICARYDPETNEFFPASSSFLRRTKLIV